MADAELGFYNAALTVELFVLFRTVWSGLEYLWIFLLGKLLSWRPRQCWEGIYRDDRVYNILWGHCPATRRLYTEGL